MKYYYLSLDVIGIIIDVKYAIITQSITARLNKVTVAKY